MGVLCLISPVCCSHASLQMLSVKCDLLLDLVFFIKLLSSLQQQLLPNTGDINKACFLILYFIIHSNREHWSIVKVLCLYEVGTHSNIGRVNCYLSRI
jgi:hypothetical protein